MDILIKVSLLFISYIIETRVMYGHFIKDVDTVSALPKPITLTIVRGFWLGLMFTSYVLNYKLGVDTVIWLVALLIYGLACDYKYNKIIRAILILECTLALDEVSSVIDKIDENK